MDFATIVSFAGVAMRVARERDAFAFIDVLRDARTRVPPRVDRLACTSCVGRPVPAQLEGWES